MRKNPETAAKQPPKMGRPPLPPAELRDRRLDLRVSAEDEALLTAAADRAGLPLATWARDLLLRAARRGK